MLGDLCHYLVATTKPKLGMTIMDGYVQIKSSSSMQWGLKLMNAQGRFVSSIASGVGNFSAKLPNNCRGVYILVLRSGSEQTAQRVYFK